jgi:hypothetical protein
MLRLGAILLTATLAVGCAPAEPGAPPDEPQPPGDLALPDGVRGGTPWRDTGLPVGFDEAQRFETPEAVVEALADALVEEMDGDGRPPQVTTDLLDADGSEANGRIVIGGFLDDSIYGVDYYVTLTSDDAGWHVAAAFTRDLCRRGAGNGVCV